MRILWLSDAPTLPTGFGLVTREVCTRLAARGHAVSVLGWWAPPVSLPGIEVAACPVAPDAAGEAIGHALRSFRPDVLVSLGDLPWVSYLATPRLRRQLDQTEVAWCAHYPIDGALPDGSMPPQWAEILRQADLPVAMSRFGQTVSAASGIAAACLPHGVDLSLFAPPADRAVARAALGLEGRFVVLSDMRNHRRKMLPRLLDIFGRFVAARPDAVLLLNTNAHVDDDRDSHRYDLRADIAALGLDTKVVLCKPAGDLRMAELARLYAASDVHLLTSCGEGFGLPTLQAAASGVVPLAGDHSANSELLGDHGVALPVDDGEPDEFGLQRRFLDRASTVAALVTLHDHPALLAQRAQAGRRFALAFDWDRLAGDWERLLTGAALCERPAPLPNGPPATPRPDGPPAATRPTGHDAAILPPPRFGLPLRPDTLVFAPAPRVLADRGCLGELQALTAIFPGLRLETPGETADLRDVILIVDPHDRILARHPAIPRIVAEKAHVFASAREVLTDPASRAAYLRRRAPGLIDVHADG